MLKSREKDKNTTKKTKKQNWYKQKLFMEHKYNLSDFKMIPFEAVEAGASTRLLSSKLFLTLQSDYLQSSNLDNVGNFPGQD